MSAHHPPVTPAHTGRSDILLSFVPSFNVTEDDVSHSPSPIPAPCPAGGVGSICGSSHKMFPAARPSVAQDGRKRRKQRRTPSHSTPHLTLIKLLISETEQARMFHHFQTREGDGDQALFGLTQDGRAAVGGRPGAGRAGCGSVRTQPLIS